MEPFVPYFSEPDRVTALLQAIDETRGTPWAQFGRVIGREGGSDCVYFPEYVFGKAGVGQGRDFHFLRTSADYQTARSYLRLLHMLRGQDSDPQSKWLAEIFAEIELPENKTNIDPSLFMAGDLAVLRDGGMFHLPVITRGRKFVHCMKPLGVTDGNMHDTSFSNHLVALFRARVLAR